MSTEPFNAEETTEIYRFLDYPDWQSVAQSVQLGYPAAGHPLFLVRDSLQRISAPSRAVVRTYLCELRAIECQLRGARGRMKATRVGEVGINANEAAQLRTEYKFWKLRLSDALGVQPNPYAQMQYAGMGGGLNAKVRP